uniref:mRNA export factor GLE1 n=1 Tax=Arion vulgaris TaxID=1028688 RepID=A0A0B6Y9Z6_9EUPU
MSEIIELKNTPKGRLQYSPFLNTNKLKLQLEQLSPPPLSRLHEERESSKLNLSFGLDPAEFHVSTPNTSTDFNDNFTYILDKSSNKTVHFSSIKGSSFHGIDIKFDTSKEDTLDIFGSPPSSGGRNVLNKMAIRSSSSCPVSPEFGYTSCAIIDADKKYSLLAQISLSKRHSEFEHHNRSLNYLMDNKEREMKSRIALQVDHRQSQIDKKLQEGVEEGYKRRQRLKDDHEEHLKKINIKHKEIERKREVLQEEERQRKEKILKLQGLWKDIDNNRQSYAQRHDNFIHKASLPELVDKYRAVLERICINLAAQVQAAEDNPNLGELINKFEEDKDKSYRALSFLDKQIGETEQKLRADEDKQKEIERKKAEKAEDDKIQHAAVAQDLAVQSLVYVLKDYEAKSKELAQVETAIRPFIENAQNKSFRFSIQRAVNTPINAISDYSGPHLMDKLKKLRDLLQGNVASLSGNNRTGNVTPEVLLFCQNLVAKMLVKKGEEQVTSKHESAFPIGTVVVALWQEFPIVGELFLAHLQSLCPYVLPMYPTRQTGQSSLDYHKSLGYKVSEDGTIEEQDKFLRRMSGLMRLYCSCMVAHLPPGVSSPHPHGLDNAWKWLARTMNLEPHPDVTAALIHDVLSVTGHSLFKEYRIQFAKLLYLVYKNYIPKLESVSVTNAAVERLKIFLDSAVQNSSIPPPEGLLSANFFFKQPDPV